MTEHEKFRILITDENSFHFFSVRSSGENNRRDFSTKIISFNLKSGKPDPMDRVLALARKLINDHYPELDADGVLENSQRFETSSLFGQLISSNSDQAVESLEKVAKTQRKPDLQGVLISNVDVASCEFFFIIYQNNFHGKFRILQTTTF